MKARLLHYWSLSRDLLMFAMLLAAPVKPATMPRAARLPERLPRPG